MKFGVSLLTKYNIAEYKTSVLQTTRLWSLIPSVDFNA